MLTYTARDNISVRFNCESITKVFEVGKAPQRSDTYMDTLEKNKFGKFTATLNSAALKQSRLGETGGHKVQHATLEECQEILSSMLSLSDSLNAKSARARKLDDHQTAPDRARARCVKENPFARGARGSQSDGQTEGEK
eukprot:952102_1